MDWRHLLAASWLLSSPRGSSRNSPSSVMGTAKGHSHFGCSRPRPHSLGLGQGLWLLPRFPDRVFLSLLRSDQVELGLHLPLHKDRTRFLVTKTCWGTPGLPEKCYHVGGCQEAFWLSCCFILRHTVTFLVLGEAIFMMDNKSPEMMLLLSFVKRVPHALVQTHLHCHMCYLICNHLISEEILIKETYNN